MAGHARHLVRIDERPAGKARAVDGGLCEMRALLDALERVAAQLAARELEQVGTQALNVRAHVLRLASLAREQDSGHESSIALDGRAVRGRQERLLGDGAVP